MKPSEPQLSFDACSVCQRDDIEEANLQPLYENDMENRACVFCKSLYHLGDEIIGMRYLGVVQDEVRAKKMCVYPIKIEPGEGSACYYVPLKRKSNDCDRVYVVNSWNMYEYTSPNTISLLIGNYVRKVSELPEIAQGLEPPNTTASFSQLAESSRGANRIGVLRMDVDNLGRIFTQGFKKETRSLSRLASLSRQLNLFFKYYINSICKGELGANLKCLDLSEKSTQRNMGRNISIVYSGGDDLFLVGAWDEVTEIAFDIEKSFTFYTGENPHLSISGGLIVQNANFPLYLLANLTGKAEKLAKQNGRNRITLFYNPALEEKRSRAQHTPRQVFLWEKAFQEVVETVKIFKSLGKIDKDSNCFKPAFSHSFIYKLFSIFEEWERSGVLYLPKMAYTYKRLTEYLSKNKKMPELGHLEKILMNREKITNLRTCLTWIDLLSRKAQKEKTDLKEV